MRGANPPFGHPSLTMEPFVEVCPKASLAGVFARIDLHRQPSGEVGEGLQMEIDRWRSMLAVDRVARHTHPAAPSPRFESAPTPRRHRADTRGVGTGRGPQPRSSVKVLSRGLRRAPLCVCHSVMVDAEQIPISVIRVVKTQRPRKCG